MPIRHPPRREPRVLAIALGRGRLAWCVADPWEFRGSGLVNVTARARAVALRRLIRREKPTAVVAGSPGLEAHLEGVARRLSIPVMSAAARPLALASATALYPEFALYAPTRLLRAVALIALGAVLEAALPTRHYAATRHRTLPRSA